MQLERLGSAVPGDEGFLEHSGLAVQRNRERVDYSMPPANSCRNHSGAICAGFRIETMSAATRGASQHLTIHNNTTP